MLRSYWDSFIMLFIVFDAVGNVPLFYSLTHHMDDRERDKVFKRSVTIAAFLLLFFMTFGWAFFTYYGVTLDDFRIAGGLLLFVIAVGSIVGRVEAEALRSEDIAVVPMATPLLAGPGSIYVVMYLSEVYGVFQALVSIALNSAIAMLLLRYSHHILRKLGKNLVLVFSRAVAFLLAVIAITLLREGIINIAGNLLNPVP